MRDGVQAHNVLIIGLDFREATTKLSGSHKIDLVTSYGIIKCADEVTVSPLIGVAGSNSRTCHSTPASAGRLAARIVPANGTAATHRAAHGLATRERLYIRGGGPSFGDGSSGRRLRVRLSRWWHSWAIRSIPAGTLSGPAYPALRPPVGLPAGRLSEHWRAAVWPSNQSRTCASWNRHCPPILIAGNRCLAIRSYTVSMLTLSQAATSVALSNGSGMCLLLHDLPLDSTTRQLTRRIGDCRLNLKLTLDRLAIPAESTPSRAGASRHRTDRTAGAPPLDHPYTAKGGQMQVMRARAERQLHN